MIDAQQQHLQNPCPEWPLPVVLALDTVLGMILVVAVSVRRVGHEWSIREFGSFPWDGISGNLGAFHGMEYQGIWDLPMRCSGERALKAKLVSCFRRDRRSENQEKG